LKFDLEDGGHTLIFFYKNSQGKTHPFPVDNADIVNSQGTEESKEMLKIILKDGVASLEDRTHVAFVGPPIPARVGFTGTQIGMSPAQFHAFCRVYKNLAPTEFHSGDCIGSDEEAHDFAESQGAWTVIHPPDDSSKRAFCKGDEIRPPKPYLERNNDIVSDSECMIAAPRQFKEVRWSGTWATIRYARKAGRKIFIIFRDGNVEEEG